MHAHIRTDPEHHTYRIASADEPMLPHLRGVASVERHPRGVTYHRDFHAEILGALQHAGFTITVDEPTTTDTRGTWHKWEPWPECLACTKPRRETPPWPDTCPDCGAALTVIQYRIGSDKHRILHRPPGQHPEDDPTLTPADRAALRAMLERPITG